MRQVRLSSKIGLTILAIEEYNFLFSYSRGGWLVGQKRYIQLQNNQKRKRRSGGNEPEPLPFYFLTSISLSQVASSPGFRVIKGLTG